MTIFIKQNFQKNQQLTSLSQWRSLSTQKTVLAHTTHLLFLLPNCILICDCYLTPPLKTKRKWHRGKGTTLNRPWELCDRGHAVRSCTAALQCLWETIEDEAAVTGEYLRQQPDMPSRCCPYHIQETNTDGYMHLTKKMDPIRTPCFAQGYPKGRGCLRTSSPVTEVELLSLRHAPVLPCSKGITWKEKMGRKFLGIAVLSGVAMATGGFMFFSVASVAEIREESKARVGTQGLESVSDPSAMRYLRRH